MEINREQKKHLNDDIKTLKRNINSGMKDYLKKKHETTYF